MNCSLFLANVVLGAAPTVGQEREPVAPPQAAAPVVEETYDVPVNLVFADRSKTPAADVTVALGVGLRGDAPRYADRPVLARVTSDEEGRAQCTVSVPVSWKDLERPYLWVRIETPGFPLRVAHRALRSREPEKPLEIRADRGGTLTGRVLAPDGSPIEGARAGLFTRLDVGIRGHSRGTDAHGRFALDFVHSGEFWLHARAAGLGSVHRAGLELAAGMDLAAAGLEEPVELVVRGGTALEGRVVDAAGEPVPGLDLIALAYPNESFPYLDTCSLAEREGGLYGDVTSTDLRGEFRFPALVQGEYRLFGAMRNGKQGWDALGAKGAQLGEPLAQRTFSPGQRAEIELSSTRLEITVRDHQGRLVEERAQFRRILGSRDNLRTTVLDVSRMVDGEPQCLLGASPVFVDGRYVLELDEPGGYLVSWRQRGVSYVELPVRVAPLAGRVPVLLQLGEPVDDVELTVEVLAPDGGPHTGNKQIYLSSRSGWTVATTARSTGFGLSIHRAPTWSISVPPSSYRIVATEDPDTGSCTTFRPIPRARHAPGSTEVVLGPGGQRTVQVRLVAAGHLDLVATSPREPPPPWEPYQVGSEEGGNVDVRRIWKHYEGRAIRLTRVGRASPLKVVFNTDALHPTCFLGSCDEVFPGWSAGSLTPIPAGSYRLEIDSPDGEPFVRDVDIRAGQVTTIDW